MASLSELTKWTIASPQRKLQLYGYTYTVAFPSQYSPSNPVSINSFVIFRRGLSFILVCTAYKGVIPLVIDFRVKEEYDQKRRGLSKVEVRLATPFWTSGRTPHLGQNDPEHPKKGLDKWGVYSSGGHAWNKNWNNCCWVEDQANKACVAISLTLALTLKYIVRVMVQSFFNGRKT